MTIACVLVANRGEIACRVIRTCRERGIRTVAVHSTADVDSLHVAEADTAVALPGEPVAAYLDVAAIVAAARTSGADAIHPGYGFLSENPSLPEACATAGITFIGPTAEVMRLMGDKAAAKTEAAAAGVPVLTSVDPTGLDEASLREAVAALGLPVIVKAVAGGGGKGMRRVDDLDDLAEAVVGAAREAAASFGDDRLLIERFVTGPRHVEIQVAGDTHGNAIHLFERDCSIQRRHQKIVEESPSPALDETLRARMGAAAVALVERVGYTNLGTVEFLLDTASDGTDFFFLEMNTRLQVEHPVTELVTGLDLVACQLDIADAGTVPEVPASPHGHAIEVRLYAEDVPAGFLPQTGKLARFWIDGVRVDAGVTAGDTITTFYDPMLAKVIAWGPDREAARRRLLTALNDARVTGVVTNLGHLRAILASPAFAGGDFTTNFLDDHLPAWQPDPLDRLTLVAAAVALAVGHRRSRVSDGRDPWVSLGSWRVSGVGGWTIHLGDKPNAATAFQVSTTTTGWTVRAGDEDHVVMLSHEDVAGPGMALTVDDESITVAVDDAGTFVWVSRPGHGSRRLAAPPRVRHVDGAAMSGNATLTAPMPGQVLEVRVASGDEVEQDDVLVVVEAMKMEHPVTAPAAGIVASVAVKVGDSVTADQTLVTLEAQEADDAA